MHYEETHCIHAEKLYQIIRIDNISSGLRHLGAFIRLGCCGKKPGVTENLLGQRNI